MFKPVLESLIDPNWRTKYEPPAYTEFAWERGPHCKDAKPSRNVHGKTYWTCKHPGRVE